MTLRTAVCAILTFVLFILAPTKAEDCKHLKGLWLELTPTPEGYLVPMSVNGKPHLFFLNLQDPYAVLDESIVAEAGLPTKKPSFKILSKDKPVEQVATARTIQLGPLPRHDAEFLVSPHFPNWGDKADGEIGINILSGLDLELDLGHNKLGLFVQDHCPFTPYWRFDVMGSAPFQVMPTSAFLMPMRLDKTEIIASFGTNNQRSYLSGTAAKMLFGIDIDSAGVIPSGQDNAGKPLYRYPFKTLSAEGVTINNPAISFHQDDHKPCGGVAGKWFNRIRNNGSCLGGGDVALGLTELKQLRFFFDFKEKKVYFTPADPIGPKPTP